MSKQTITIEKTSKKYKGGKVIGICMLITGIFMIGVSPLLAGLLALGGIGICIYCRIGAWWNNG